MKTLIYKVLVRSLIIFYYTIFRACQYLLPFENDVFLFFLLGLTPSTGLIPPREVGGGVKTGIGVGFTLMGTAVESNMLVMAVLLWLQLSWQRIGQWKS